VTIRQAGTLDDGVSQTEVAKRLRKAEHHVGERCDAEVGGREEASEEHTDRELGDGADERAGEPPPHSACRLRRQTFDG
jgi:hypothetical protein